MRSVLRVLLVATSVTLFTGVAATLGPTPVHASDGEKAPPAATKTTAEPPAKDVASQGMTTTAWVSLFGALLSGLFAALAYKLSRTTAFRTATIESQRMLLDINKAYLADPKLLAIEGEYDASTVTDPEFPAKLKAMAYMKLNVFEVVFPVLPRGRGRDAWVAYFESSLSKCGLLAKELENHRGIYHRDLIRAYDAWKAKVESVGKRT